MKGSLIVFIGVFSIFFLVPNLVVGQQVINYQSFMSGSGYGNDSNYTVEAGFNQAGIGERANGTVTSQMGIYYLIFGRSTLFLFWMLTIMLVGLYIAWIFAYYSYHLPQMQLRVFFFFGALYFALLDIAIGVALIAEEAAVNLATILYTSFVTILVVALSYYIIMFIKAIFDSIQTHTRTR